MLNTHMNHGMGGREGESGEPNEAKYKLDDVLISICVVEYKVKSVEGKQQRGCLVTASFPPSLSQEEETHVCKQIVVSRGA